MGGCSEIREEDDGKGNGGETEARRRRMKSRMFACLLVSLLQVGGEEGLEEEGGERQVEGVTVLLVCLVQVGGEEGDGEGDGD
jgi:hypothetical protein